jgi:hypothetical protein
MRLLFPLLLTYFLLYGAHARDTTIEDDRESEEKHEEDVEEEDEYIDVVPLINGQVLTKEYVPFDKHRISLEDRFQLATATPPTTRSVSLIELLLG